MHRVLLIVLLFSFCLTGQIDTQDLSKNESSAVSGISYVLFSGAKSDYRIALGSQASQSERWAASELQRWLKAISGAELPVQPVEQPFNGPQIILGFNDRVKDITGKTAPADPDESLISRLLRNPDCNAEDVTNDFMYGFYGRSGKYVRQYFDLLYGRINPDTHIHIEDHIYKRKITHNPYNHE